LNFFLTAAFMAETNQETAESLNHQNVLAQQYNSAKETLDGVVDSILDYHNGDTKQVRKSHFYRQAKELTGRKHLEDYIGKHGDKQRFLNRLGVDLGWLTNVQPNEIEAKWSGSPTTIVDLKKMRLAAFSNLNLKMKAWNAEFEQALVWLVLFKSCF
jgi:hypothetical protein